MNNRLYYLAFSHFFPIGPVKFKLLLKHSGNVKEAYEGSKKRLTSLLGTSLAQKFFHFRSSFDPIKKSEELKTKGIQFISQEDRSYFPQLQNISDPPIGIYCKGNIRNFDPDKDVYIAVVGTRRPTSYGEQIAKKLSSELSICGAVTVSGMAMGIDGIVHRSTLEVGGRTIAVLGSGVDVIYPSCNRNLYEDIIKNKGLIISEFFPGQRPVPGYFILRNRLISGLSKGVLVIEGMKDSGTLITAGFAASQGREVFAVPSSITSPLSEAPNILLKQGATLVTCIEDIIRELGLSLHTIRYQEMYLTDREKQMKDSLYKEPKSADELEIELKIPIGEVLQTLTVLEMKKIIEKNSEGKYQVQI